MLKDLKINTIQDYFLILLVSLLYFTAGKMSFALTSDHNIVTIVIFAPEGIALAMALFFGKKVIPGIFLGQLILALSSGMNMMPSIEISFINSIEAMIGIFLFDKYKLNKELLKLKDIMGLVIIIVFALQPFSAIMGNTILLLNSIISSDEYFGTLFSWWFGNIMGQLLFTPFVLLLLINYKTIKFFEYFIYGLLFTIFIYMLEVILIIENVSLLLTFTMPVVILVVAYKGLGYGTLLAIVVAVVSSYSVYLGVGVFAANTAIDNIININFFILAHISMVLIAGGLFEERRQTEILLHKTIHEEVIKNKEQQLLMFRQSRLAQMGEMIAMIAHQWRQPLNNLSLVNQLLLSKYAQGKLNDEAIAYFQKNSKKQIVQMSTTIDDFRNFFKSEKERQRFCVNDIIGKVLGMTEPIYAVDGIKIGLHAESDYYTTGYPNEFGQAVLNIINNSKDALIEKDVKDKYINISIEIEEENILITVSDNAGGIPENIIDKIFDPYFSTKNDKNGTGLGLYMTKIIIEDHLNAKIIVKNSNDGVSFRIYLPVE